MPKEEEGFRSVSLRSDLITDIDKFIQENPEAGYKSIADFVQEAVRGLVREVKKTYNIAHFQHLNTLENHITIIDNRQKRVVDVYPKEPKQQLWCELCNSTKCEHIKFAYTIPEVRKTLKERGWNLPEP